MVRVRKRVQLRLGLGDGIWLRLGLGKKMVKYGQVRKRVK